MKETAYYSYLFDPKEEEARLSIRTFKDLLDYNVRFLNGEFKKTFYHGAPILPDQSVESLINLQKAGIFTTDGQGYICETEPKYHEPTKHLYYFNDELNDEIESDLEYSMTQQRQYLIGFMKRETAKKLAKALETTSLCGYIRDLDGNMYFERKCDGDLTRGRFAHRSNNTKENILSKNWAVDTTMPEPFHEYELHDGWWSNLKDIYDNVKENWDEWKDLCICQIYEGEWCKKSNEVNDLPSLLTNYITMSGGKVRKTRRARKSRKSRKLQRRGRKRA